MKLFTSPTTPYGRMVAVTALEKGLEDRITAIRVDPWSDPPEFQGVAPVGKVPALVTEEGIAIAESLMIMEHLDEAAQQPSLMPPGGQERADARARLGVAKGIVDAAIAAVMEGRRPEAYRWADWVARQEQAIRRSVEWLDRHGFETAPRLDSIATAVALAYLDFRHPHLGWRAAAPNLVPVHEAWMARDSMVRTAPPTG